MIRGASNHARLKPIFELRAKSDAPFKDVLILGQNDQPRTDGKNNGHQTLQAGVEKLAMETGLEPRVVFPPTEYNGTPIKDFNDYAKAWPDLDIDGFLSGSTFAPKCILSESRMFDLWKEPSHPEWNYWGDKMLYAGAPMSMLAAPGTGKSRLSLQLAFCMILGRDFLGEPTNAKGKTWLFIQTENSNERLKDDTMKMAKGMKLTDEERQYVNERIVFHTVKTAEDAWLALDVNEEREAAAELGLLKPLIPKHAAGAPSHDAAESKLAKVDPPPLEIAQPTVGAEVATILAEFCARLRGHNDPGLIFDAICFATGIASLEGQSCTALAQRHGITKQAFSRIAVEWSEILGLPPSRFMKSKRARRVYHARAINVHSRLAQLKLTFAKLP